MSEPLVSIVCVCYNHQPYVEEALTSVFNQTYPSIQLIVVDDNSTDGSQELLRKLQITQSFELLLLPENNGYCRAFNRGWALAQGDYIIDLAADDKLVPQRVQLGVEGLEDCKHAVQFGDARFIDGNNRVLGTHYTRDGKGRLLESVPSGNLYARLLQRYFICAPTMMMKREVLEYLQGYDEQLSYEDFDFWIRSARQFTYQFCDQVLVEKRVLPSSMSKKQYSNQDDMMRSTLKVCQKALQLNRQQSENEALSTRVHYEIRQAIICHHYHIAEDYLDILWQIEGQTWAYKTWLWLVQRRWDFRFLMPLMRKAR